MLRVSHSEGLPATPPKPRERGRVVYSLLAVVSLAVWGLLSRLTLEHATWAQAVFVFGVATVIVLGGATLVGIGA